MSNIFGSLKITVKNYLLNQAKERFNLHDADDFADRFDSLLDLSVNLKNPVKRGRLGAFPVARPRVAAFGTNDDWRRNGIWKALTRFSDFHLFEVPDENYNGAISDSQEREFKRQDFLAFINKLHYEKPVDFAFFSHSGRHISNLLLEDLRKSGIGIIIMSVDDKHQFLYPLDISGKAHQLRVAGKADLYWTNWEGALPIIRAEGGNPWFAPPAADPDVYHPTDCIKEYDIVFVGGCYGIRKKFIEKLQRWFKVEAFGNGWTNGPVSHKEMISLMGKSRIVLGISGVGDSIAVQTLKGRDFEVPMCGAAYLTSFNSEYAKCFDIGREVFCYSSVEDCAEIANWLLKNPETIESAGRKARERASEQHTWDKRVEELIKEYSSGKLSK